MSEASPTVVLVHGAFADASSWNGVIERLQAKGVPVIAPANPLRGIAHDSAYTAAVFEQIEGPVLAVGHSYSGAVISNAATDAKNVVGLVYVAAFAPDEGEALGEASAGSKDSVLGSAQIPLRYPTENGGGTEMKWDADVKIAGPVGSMGQRVLQPIVNQQVNNVLTALDKQVQEAHATQA